jgi:immune inhibitor A
MIANPTRRWWQQFASRLLLSTILLLLSGVTQSSEPNLEDRDDFETVDNYRRRMGIEFHYKMRILSPELCRDSTEQECEEMEDDFFEQAERLRNLQNNQHQNSTHDARNLQNTDSTGTINVVVLLIRFTNHASRVLPDPSQIETLFNDPGQDEDITPTGSVSTYLETNSYGNLKINAFVAPSWVDAAGDEQFCAQSTNGVNDDFMSCFLPALDALEDSGINWFDYDKDGDGRLDAVIVLHSGYANNQGAMDEDGVESSLRIQSHARSSPQPPWTSPSTGISLGNFVVTSTYVGSADQNICRINVICHEFLHILGVIDIYDLSFQTNGAGGFALMAYPYGHTGTTAGSTTPGNVSPWIKIQLGWLTPIPIETDGTYQITPSLTTPQVYIISDPYPEGEYLLIENRQAKEWDSAMNGSGVVIWSIDDSIEGNTAEGQEVVVLQADGLFDLENKRNFGDEGDFFLEGRELGPTGDVNTNSRRTGATTGFTLSGFSASSKNMSFTVSDLATQQVTTPTPTPVPTTNRTQAPTIAPTAVPIPGTTPSPTLSTPAPTPGPTGLSTPTSSPTVAPTPVPTMLTPTVTPTTTSFPTAPPTPLPTLIPTSAPTTSPIPTRSPDLCKVYDYDCFGCIDNGCYFCPGDALCFDSDRYMFNVFSHCQVPEDYTQNQCQQLENWFRYASLF